MTPQEQKYVEKLELFFEATHCYCSNCQKFKKELSALKTELKEEQLSGTVKWNPDTMHLSKEERSGLKKFNESEWADPL